jgi:hypothetical protein
MVISLGTKRNTCPVEDKIGQMIGVEVRRSVKHYLAAASKEEVCSATVTQYWETLQYWLKKMEAHRKEKRSQLGRSVKS